MTSWLALVSRWLEFDYATLKHGETVSGPMSLAIESDKLVGVDFSLGNLLRIDAVEVEEPSGQWTINYETLIIP